MNEPAHQFELTQEASGVQEPISEIKFLANTQNRYRILDKLHSSELDSDGLKQSLKIPQTTLRRNLLELEEKNWIQSSPQEGTYQLTPAGKLVINYFNEMLEQILRAKRVGEFYSRLPKSVPLSDECLHSCTITTAESYDPYNPVAKLIDVFESSTNFRGYAPLMNPRCMEKFSRHAPKEEGHQNAKFEFITTPRMINILQEKHSSPIGVVPDDCSKQLFVLEDLPRVGICKADNLLVAFVYDSTQRIHSLIEIDKEYSDTHDWAEQQYTQYREMSVEYSPAQ